MPEPDDHKPDCPDEATPEAPLDSTPDPDGPDEDGVTAPEGQVPVDPAETTDPVSGDARVRTINRAVLGQLVLHYESRDVTVVLDGDAGLRVMTMFANRKEGRWADTLDPEESWALSGWLVLDLHEPLAMSWLPGLPARSPRTTVDPAPAA